MKRRWREKTAQLAMQMLEIPKDTLHNVPRITIIGNMQVVIENYQSIEEFADDRIRIKAVNRDVTVRGEQLVIRSIVPEEVIIEGIIKGVDMN